MTKTIKLSLVASLFTTSVAIANENLGTITVSSATKSEQSIQDVTSNIDVITGVELEEKHITTVTQALNLVSGISFTSNGGLGQLSSVRVRGFDSKRVLVLIDGVRYNDITGLNGAPFENLMATDIAKIEIIKGAQSGIWGADASAGVINIITKSPKKGLHGELEGEFGSFNTKKYGAIASYNTGKFYTKISSQKITSDGFTAQAPRGKDIDQYEDDKYTNTTTNFKAGVKIDDTNKIDLSHTIIDAKGDYDLGQPNDQNSHSTTYDTFSSLNYENKNSIATTNMQYKKSKFDREYSSSGTIYNYNGNVDEYGIKTNLKYFKDSSFLILGLDYKEFKEEDTTRNNYINKGFFATNNNKLDKIIVTESIRVDYFDKFDNKTTGKFGIKYNFTDTFNIFSNIGNAYNVPNLSYLYGAFGPNPNLSPETTKSYDAGLQYKDIKITYFENKIDNMISWYDPDGWIGPIAGKYKNIDGVSTLKGYEIEYQKEIVKDTLLTLNYTELSAKDKDGKVLPRRPENTLKFGIDYYGIAKTHIGLNGEYVGTRYDRLDKQGEQTGRYTTANFNIDYKITNQIKIYCKIDNITDKYYQTADGYATSPRAYYAGVKYSF